MSSLSSRKKPSSYKQQKNTDLLPIRNFKRIIVNVNGKVRALKKQTKLRNRNRVIKPINTNAVRLGFSIGMGRWLLSYF